MFNLSAAAIEWQWRDEQPLREVCLAERMGVEERRSTARLGTGQLGTRAVFAM